MPLLLIAGTRPEVLKLAPIAVCLGRGEHPLSAIFCLSGQQGALARDVARDIGLSVGLELPSSDRPLDLSENLAALLVRLDGVIGKIAPRGVVIQGDTTTALAGALAAFHRGLPCFHVEAGLRTSDPTRPFPEEMNRRLIGRLASRHFAPTEGARENLLREGIAPEDVEVTGNTVVDALRLFGGGTSPAGTPMESDVAAARRLVLVTLHRREGREAAEAVVAAVHDLSRRTDVEVVWVRHPNATGRAAVEALRERTTVRVLEPQPYVAFVGLLQRAHVVLTDSGGVQEEACVLGVPAVVLRTETDRPESVGAGNAVVAGTDPATIVRACEALLDAATARERSAPGRIGTTPFGDGDAAGKIVASLSRWFSQGR